MTVTVALSLGGAIPSPPLQGPGHWTLCHWIGRRRRLRCRTRSGAAVVSAAFDRTLDGLEVGASVVSAAVASAAGQGALDERRLCQRSCAAAAAAVC